MLDFLERSPLMSPLRRMIPSACLLGLVLILAGPAARADQIWNVTISNSANLNPGVVPQYFPPNANGNFGLDFELVGGNNNTVTLHNFHFGTGLPGLAGPFTFGGASGDLRPPSSDAILTDDPTVNPAAGFLNDFNQQFTPGLAGSMITFTMDSTLNFSPPTPDNFSMVLFYNYDTINGYNPGNVPPTGGTPIPTQDAINSTLFSFDITGPNPTVNSFMATDGTGITVTVTPVTVIPEPSSLIMLVSGYGAVVALGWRRFARRGHSSV
jgi:hypothetical protein